MRLIFRLVTILNITIYKIRHYSRDTLTHISIKNKICATEKTPLLSENPKYKHSWTSYLYRNLIYVDGSHVGIENWDWLHLIKINKQLETLKMVWPSDFFTSMNNKLDYIFPYLAHLCFYKSNKEIGPMPDSIEISSLETFELSGMWSSHECVLILLAMTASKNINKIILDSYWDDEIIFILENFQDLEYLEILSYYTVNDSLTLEDLNNIIMQLPILVELKCSAVEGNGGDVPIGKEVASIISMGSTLKHISIEMNTLIELNHSVITDIARITQLNPQLSVTLDVVKGKAVNGDKFKTHRWTSHQGVFRHHNSILYWSG